MAECLNLPLSILIVIMLSLTHGCTGESTARPADFEVALWPGEGRPVLEALSGELTLHESADVDSSRSVVTVAPGQRVPFIETLYRTNRAGSAAALGHTTIEGRDFGTISRLSKDSYYRDGTAATVAVESGDDVEYLQSRAEGTCFVRLQDRVIEAAPCVLLEPGRFRLDAKPAVEWWVRVELPEAGGWVLVDGRQLEVVERTF